MAIKDVQNLTNEQLVQEYKKASKDFRHSEEGSQKLDEAEDQMNLLFDEIQKRNLNLLDFTTTKYYEEISRNLKDKGYKVTIQDDQESIDKYGGITAKIFKDDEAVSIVNKDGDLLLSKNISSAESDYLIHTAQSVKEYINNYNNAENLDVEGNANKYRKLMEFNNTVLAAKQLSNGEFEFVTWNAKGNGLSSGHYFNDYDKAKEDMAVRCGLINKEKMFTETEIKILHSNLVAYSLDEPKEKYNDLGFSEKIDVDMLVEKIEKIMPEVKKEYDLDAKKQNNEMKEERNFSAEQSDIGDEEYEI